MRTTKDRSVGQHNYKKNKDLSRLLRSHAIYITYLGISLEIASDIYLHLFSDIASYFLRYSQKLRSKVGGEGAALHCSRMGRESQRLSQNKVR